MRRKASKSASSSLLALTAAALSLPGMVMTEAQGAEGDEATVQYGLYKEGKRQLYGYNSKFDPIQVDSLNAGTNFTLLDRIKFAFHFAQDTWAGATPMTSLPFAAMTQLTPTQIQAGASAKPDTGLTPAFRVDQLGNAYRQTGDSPATRQFVKDTRDIHMMTSASVETRKQIDLNLGYEWDEAALTAGGGFSDELDYQSRFLSLNGRMDFNQKLTTVNAGFSHTAAVTSVVLPDTWNGWTNSEIGIQLGEIQNAGTYPNGNPKLVADNRRKDWSGNLGVTQVLGKTSVLQAGFGYTNSSGYLENSYKAVSFITRGEALTGALGLSSDGTQLYQAGLSHIYEQRPDERNQFNWNAKFIQHIPFVDAALHFGYRFYHDDWGIDAHTFEGDWVQPLGNGWTITPRFRYYSQSAADFYHPYVFCGSTEALQCARNLGNFSSDHRLSGFGAISGGGTVSKEFVKGISFEASGEFYTHQGSLKLGGGGEGEYADFDYYVVNANMRVDLDRAFDAGGAFDSMGEGMDHSQHAGHMDHQGHGGHAHGPAGVMYDHMIEDGKFMVGYRYMYSQQAGNILHGTSTASDREIVVDGGCAGVNDQTRFYSSKPCAVKPLTMNMHMHMVDLMYAPTDWLNLMLMPTFMDMNMTMGQLEGGAPSPHASHPGHQTGGVGDTGMYGLVKLFDAPGHHIHTTIGLTAPTGDSGIRLNPVAGHSHDPNTVKQAEFIHYGMQLGSGTWDFKPSITYTGNLDRWSWGAQLNATTRLDSPNDQGYRLGDTLQTTAWGSYQILDWLSASVRGSYTAQGKVRGIFKTHTWKIIDPTTNQVTTINLPNDITGPMDSPNSYGGQYWDVGFGVNVMVPSGPFKGNTLSFEWLQPVSDNVNGYQLERESTLYATWGIVF